MFTTSTVELIDSMGDDRRACEAARVSLLNDAPDGEGLSARDERLRSNVCVTYTQRGTCAKETRTRMFVTV